MYYSSYSLLVVIVYKAGVIHKYIAQGINFEYIETIRGIDLIWIYFSIRFCIIIGVNLISCKIVRINTSIQIILFSHNGKFK